MPRGVLPAPLSSSLRRAPRARSSTPRGAPRRAILVGLFAVTVALGAALTPLGHAQAPRSWLLDVREGYRAFGRVDDELRWAPWLCRLPLPSAARVSRAEAGHGRKVYFVYASDRQAYLNVTRAGARPPRGLTVVKESFHPAPVADEDQRPAPSPIVAADQEHDFRYRAARGEDGRFTGRGEAAGLYVMRYTGRRRGTDDGWVYGTVTPDGEVTADGVVESCASCHRAAPHGRLFGL